MNIWHKLLFVSVLLASFEIFAFTWITQEWFFQITFYASVFWVGIVSAMLVFHYFYQRRQLTSASYIAFLIAILINPVVQTLYLEPIDHFIGINLREKADQAALKGISRTELEFFLDRPYKITTVSDHKKDAGHNPIDHSSTYITWHYHQLPGYLFGSKFQVFIDQQGVVSGYEANDD